MNSSKQSKNGTSQDQQIIFDNSFNPKLNQDIIVEIKVSTITKDTKDLLYNKYILKDLWYLRTEFKEQLEYKLNQIYQNV